MPYFKIDGKLIVNPTDTRYKDCPVEVVPANSPANSSSSRFFKSSGTVELSGVTDSNYKLCSTLSNTSQFIKNDNDAFNSRLKINGVVQPYCKKGCAPIGECLYTAAQGTYTLIREVSGEFYIKNSSGTRLCIFSSAAENRKIFTIAACGAGGGGAGGGYGMFGSSKGGGGGGSGASVIFQIRFKDNISQQLTFSLTVGSGGGGGSKENDGGAGGSTTFSIKSPVNVTIFIANGGGGGKCRKQNGGEGGSGGTYSFDNNNSQLSPYFDINILTTQDGINPGSSTSISNNSWLAFTYNNTINSNSVAYGTGNRQYLTPGSGESYNVGTNVDKTGGAGAPSWIGGFTSSFNNYSFWEPYIYGRDIHGNNVTVTAGGGAANERYCYWAKTYNDGYVKRGSSVEFYNAYPYWGAGGYGGYGTWIGNPTSGHEGGTGMFSVFY